MYLLTSNRLENLLEPLAGKLKDDPLPPMQRETIVVQSLGMERWLSLELAKRLGICANIEFPFPNKLTWQLFRACLPNLPDISPFDAGCLQWTIMRLLPDYLAHDAFAELRHYLADDADGLKLFQLAQRIANVFDQYVIYRQDWVLDWQEKPHVHEQKGHWQAMLWNALRDFYQNADNLYRVGHRAELWQDLTTRLHHGEIDLSRLPPRLTVFGIATLPPFFIEILNELSRRIPVYLLILNPCREYWGDIKSAADIARISAKGKPPLDPEAEYLAIGNPLLASMGKLGRDFLDNLTGNYDVVEQEFFVDVDESTLLGRLQGDILDLRDVSVDSEFSSPSTSAGSENSQPTDNFQSPPIAASHVLSLSPGARSSDGRDIQLHNCHSPMREVEVLHDRLLALFDADEDLMPSDVVVMMPDIESYAPLIQAVFGTSRRRIPFSIADRGARIENQLFEAYTRILELTDSRLTLNDVLGLLQLSVIQEQFDLLPAEVQRIRDWLDAAGVRWGMDAAHRLAEGLPEFNDNSWQFGLDRLLLGYALPVDDLFHGILPYHDIEGSATEALGKFLDFADALFTACRELKAPRPPAEWQSALLKVLDTFFARTDNHRQSQDVRNALEQLTRQIAPADFNAPVSLNAMRTWLQATVEEAHVSSGFITGSVTFCAMLPMRSIPFKAVCLLGLNSSSYPRRHQAPGFDLISQYSRKGDRSRRNDDRYLFLEALLSARRYFYLSYVGQSIQDNSEIPPSVLVSELLDYLRSCGVDMAQRVIKHPLQAFSRRYFDASDPALFSYAQEYCEASAAQQTEQAPFLAERLPAPDIGLVTLTDLIRFFSNPARYFLENRLKVRLQTLQAPLADDEPFDLNNLEQYAINQALLYKLLASDEAEPDFYPLFKAEGCLPACQVGEAVWQDLAAELQRFHARLQPLLEKTENTALDAVLDFAGGGSLHGHIPGQQRVLFRTANVKGKDLLRLWIQHLFINATQKKGVTSYHVGRDMTCYLPPVDDARQQLQQLLNLYKRGQREVLAFFPETSKTYAEQMLKQKPPIEALRRARQAWDGVPQFGGESMDAHFQVCFRGKEALDSGFEALAAGVYTPLLQRVGTEKA
jgi:exodeoxyribonuclease V gamma subunit